MRSVLVSVGALLISAAILLAGGGLLSTLVAVRAQLEGFSIFSIGLLSSAYYAGFIIGCFYTPYLVNRVGHVRVFAALAALTAASALLHVIAINIPAWLLLRVLTGFSFAGLYMLIESWINEQTPNEKRGQVLSIYRMVDLGAVTAGQFMLTLAPPSEFILFSIVAICICAAIFPISLSSAKAPSGVTQTSLNLKKLLRTSPLAVVGGFAVGLTNGAFWGVAPVFVQQLGYPIALVAVFMSITIFSGGLLQWPIGWVSDKWGRRGVLAIVAAGGTFSGIFLWQYSAESIPMLLIGGALYGAFGMQIFGLCAAHANDYAEPDEFVAISGGLLLTYGVGSVVGPSIAPILMTYLSPSSLFAYTAIIHMLFFVYTLYRLSRRTSPNSAIDYVSIPRPRSLNLILRVDPRIAKKRKKRKH